MNLSIKQISKRVFEIYGVIDGHFIKRQFIGYTEEQAKERFEQALEEGEFDYGE